MARLPESRNVKVGERRGHTLDLIGCNMCVCNISYILINTCMVIYKMDFIMLIICYYLYVCKTKLYKYLIMKYSISLRCSIVMLSNEIHVKTLYNFSRRLLVETFYNVFYKVFALRYIYVLTLFMQNF